MAGWSLLTDGSVLNCLGVLHKLQSNGFQFDPDAPLNDRLRCLFDHILSDCLKQVSDKEARPLPVMLYDGRSLDLFRLYLDVKGKGGYDSVTENRWWSSVAEGLGLGSQCGSSVKLIYVKYLHVLEIWLQRFLTHMEGFSGMFLAENGFVNNRRSFSVELKPEVEALLRELSMLEKLHKYSELDCEGISDPAQPKENGHVVSGGNSGGRDCEYDAPCVICIDDEDDDDDDDDDDVRVLDGPCLKNYDVNSLKRKQESLSDMLNWLKIVAKEPGDPSSGSIIEGYWKNQYEVQECHARCLAAREVLFLQKHVNSSPGVSLLLKRQKIHPSIYETSTSLRCSQRLLSLQSHQNSASSSSLASSSIPVEESTKRPPIPLDSSSAEMGVDFFGKDQVQKRVPVGPLYQAHVPDWTGPVGPKSSSFTSGNSDDLKWLGTQFWPLKVSGKKNLIEREVTGKGRSDSCGCQFPGSIECIRFHVSAKRYRLKLELDSAFYGWRFDQMGEEVSLTWTDQEEQRFKAIVRLNPPSTGKSFWDQIYQYLPSKSKKSLVSYYFNAFVLRRRGFQNRFTPDSIDSDDDESEPGTFGNSSSACTSNIV